MEQVRVLHVIGAMNRAGAETIIMNLMRSIDRERFHFDFLVHTMKPSDYDEEIWALGGTVYRIQRYGIINGTSYRNTCRRFFAEHPEIDIVHGHINSCAAIYLDEARKAGCATVVHSHRDSPKGTSLQSIVRRRLYGQLIRNLPEIADEFLACGFQAGIDRFGTDVVNGPHFNIMRNGIDAAAYSCDEAAHLAAKQALGFGDIPLVGDVARLVPEKNHRFLLEVFAKTLAEVPDARLVLLGRGPQEAALKEQAAELGISGSVSFLGVRDDVPEVLKALDAFVFPSLLEGLGMAVVEAQAAGVPCIISQAVPTDALVTDLAQRIGLDEGTDEWARRLVGILRDPKPRIPRAADVREHGYDIADTAAWMEDFYTKLAIEKGRHALHARKETMQGGAR